MVELTKKQFETMNERVELLDSKEKELTTEIIAETENIKSDDIPASSLYQAKISREAAINELKELKQLLKVAQLAQYNSEKIEIGTTFSAEINGEEDLYTLVQLNPNMNDKEVSLSSPFGKAVQGKKVNDSFSYEAPAGKFTGRITSIEKEMIKGNQKTLGTIPTMKKGN